MLNAQCTGNPADFTYQTNPYYKCCANFNACNYGGSWNYGDGSQPTTTGSHCFPANGSYTVSYTYGGDVSYQTISVNGYGCVPVPPVCNLVPSYCLTNYTSWQTGLWSYAGNDTYSDLSSGGSHSTSWVVTFATHNGDVTEVFSGSQISCFYFSTWTIDWNAWSFVHTYKYVSKVCMTISNASCTRATCSPSCALPLKGGGGEELAMLAVKSNMLATPTLLYPNPIGKGQNTTINIAKFNLESSFRVSIADMSGRLIREEQLMSPQTSLRTENMSSGLYLISIFENDKKISTLKLVVK
jgi:hypothetical protein